MRAAAFFDAALCVTYLVAFASVGLQAPGLFGFDGLEPVASFVQKHGGAESFGGEAPRGAEEFLRIANYFPSLVWLAGDVGLPHDVLFQALAVVGSILAVLALALGGGALLLAPLWLLYLSIYVCGQVCFARRVGDFGPPNVRRGAGARGGVQRFRGLLRVAPRRRS